MIMLDFKTDEVYKKILFVNDFKERVGGVETYCYSLIELLSAKGYEVKIVGKTYNKNRYKMFLPSVLDIKFYFSIKKYLSTYKPDIVHVHSISANVSPLFLYAVKRYKIPVIMTVHGFSHLICPQSWMLCKMKKPCEYGFGVRCILFRCHPKMNFLFRTIFWIKVWIHRMIVKQNVDLYISPSKILAEYLRENFHAKNIRVLPLFDDTKSQDYSTTTQGNDILFVGRLSDEKGIEDLIKAMPLILKTCSDAKLHIVGEGNKSKIKGIINRYMDCAENSIILHGYMDHNELSKVYSNASVFVLPSICMESFGLVILEAMSFGIPVITTRLGGQAELIEDGYNGYLVNFKNPQDIAEKIINILTDRRLHEYLSTNALIFHDKYSIDSHLSTLHNIYTNILKKSDAKND